jgi:hypothetical protein
MTEPLSDFWFKKIGKMIDSEDNDGNYDLSETYEPMLMDELGYIDFKRFGMNSPPIKLNYSLYVVTEAGRKAYKEWKDDNKNPNVKLLPNDSRNDRRSEGVGPDVLR